MASTDTIRGDIKVHTDELNKFIKMCAKIIEKRKNYEKSVLDIVEQTKLSSFSELAGALKSRSNENKDHVRVQNGLVSTFKINIETMFKGDFDNEELLNRLESLYSLSVMKILPTMKNTLVNEEIENYLNEWYSRFMNIKTASLEQSDVSDGEEAEELIQLKAIYDNDPGQDSELAFKKGDILILVQKSSDHWWWAENKSGETGYVPSAYVKIIEAEPDARSSDAETTDETILEGPADEKQEETNIVSAVALNSDMKHVRLSKHRVSIADGKIPEPSGEKDAPKIMNTMDMYNRINELRDNQEPIREMSLEGDDDKRDDNLPHAEGLLKRIGRKLLHGGNPAIYEEGENDDARSITGSFTEEYLANDINENILDEYGLNEHTAEVSEIVLECVKYILARGSKEEGIFRIPGIHSRIQDLYSQFKSGNSPDLSQEYDPMTVAGLLKYYCMKDPDSIVTESLLREARKSYTLPDIKRISMLKLAINNEDIMPLGHRNALYLVMRMFKVIIDNKEHTRLDIKGISTVFGPSLFRDGLSVSSAISSMTFWLTNYEKFFH